MLISGFESNIPQTMANSQQNMMMQKQLAEQKKQRNQNLWMEIAKMILGQEAGGKGMGVGGIGGLVGGVGKLIGL